MNNGCTGFGSQACDQRLKFLTVAAQKPSRAGGKQAAGQVVALEFLFVILPFSETATEPTTTKSTRTLASKPTGTL